MSRPMTPGAALLPVRLFLGLTFVYAGYQKLSDPGFLTPGASTYIGTQLHAFASGTPGGFLLRWFALPFPRAAGVGVAQEAGDAADHRERCDSKGGFHK